jgi:hypothetical protein
MRVWLHGSPLARPPRASSGLDPGSWESGGGCRVLLVPDESKHIHILTQDPRQRRWQRHVEVTLRPFSGSAHQWHGTIAGMMRSLFARGANRKGRSRAATQSHRDKVSSAVAPDPMGDQNRAVSPLPSPHQSHPAGAGRLNGVPFHGGPQQIIVGLHIRLSSRKQLRPCPTDEGRENNSTSSGRIGDA